MSEYEGMEDDNHIVDISCRGEKRKECYKHRGKKKSKRYKAMTFVKRKWRINNNQVGMIVRV